MAQSRTNTTLKTTGNLSKSYRGYACIDANVNDSVKRLGWPFVHGGRRNNGN